MNSQARRNKNAAKVAESIRKREEKANPASKRAEEKAAAQKEATAAEIDKVLAANAPQYGVWEKKGHRKWVFTKQEKSKATTKSVYDEASTLFEDTRGEVARSMLQRRWRAMTGLELTSDHPTMQGLPKPKKGSGAATAQKTSQPQQQQQAQQV